MGRWGKASAQNFSNLLLNTLTEGAVTTKPGAYSSISQPSSSAVARTLECLVGVPFKAASCGREEVQVQINIQKAREYLEGGNQASPRTSTNTNHSAIAAVKGNSSEDLNRQEQCVGILLSDINKG